MSYVRVCPSRPPVELHTLWEIEKEIQTADRDIVHAQDMRHKARRMLSSADEIEMDALERRHQAVKLRNECLDSISDSGVAYRPEVERKRKPLNSSRPTTRDRARSVDDDMSSSDITNMSTRATINGRTRRRGRMSMETQYITRVRSVRPRTIFGTPVRM